MQQVVIIGAGKVGQTLGFLLNRSSRYRIAAVCCRNQKHSRDAVKFVGRGAKSFSNPVKAVARGDIILITTPDNAIKKICNLLSEKANLNGKIIIHCSGNFSSAVLKNARLKGAYVGAMHPLQTFAAPSELIRIFPGTYCTYEGTSQIMALIKDIIKSIRGVPVPIGPDMKPLYHAAGVVLSNYLVTLMDIGRRFLICSGFNPSEAAKALLPLAQGTLANIAKLGTIGALTGPIARADAGIITDHIKAIRCFLPAYVRLYKELGRHTIRLALEKKSISAEQARRMQKLFD
ncbi:MAG: F420-dependent NADP oxidoreductase [Planctomycetota bacterium]